MKRPSIVPALVCGAILIFAYHSANAEVEYPTQMASGLHLYIDHDTGCHYLKTKHSSLVPRIMRNDKGVIEQVCGGQMIQDVFKKTRSLTNKTKTLPERQSIIMELNEQ